MFLVQLQADPFHPFSMVQQVWGEGRLQLVDPASISKGWFSLPLGGMGSFFPNIDSIGP